VFFLLDRRGGLHELPHDDGEPAARALVKNGIPPTSVLVYRGTDDSVVPDQHPLVLDQLYTARLIEGYDLAGIRELYEDDLNSRSRPSDDEVFVKRRLAVESTGALRMERHALSVPEAAGHVEETVLQTLDSFDLIKPNEKIVIGLSGGVDSGSLLMLLSQCLKRSSDLGASLVAATFQDFDSRHSEAFNYAQSIAHKFDVEHRLVSADSAERAFHLNRPIAQILMLLMESEDAHQAMYVDHHTTRRVLEVFATEVGTSTVALGLHATDLLAGLLNSMTSGYEVGGIPEREVGSYRYILPLAFVPKRELHMYYTHQLDHLPKQTTPNQWEFNPTDRNFYYYLADQLQWQWPGIQHWMFTAKRPGSVPTSQFRNCENCGGATRDVAPGAAWSGVCDVCELLTRHGWVSR